MVGKREDAKRAAASSLIPPKEVRMEAVVLSQGVQKIANIKTLLPEFSKIHRNINPLNRENISAVLGWGYKPSSVPAREFAEKHGIRYIALEDGFLRSLRLGVEGEAPLSLVVDPVGIYYDAGRPSHLENLLGGGGWENPQLLERAARCARMMRDYRLSKYNSAPDCNLNQPLSPKDRWVLLVDQTVGDESVHRGGADGRTFLDMLDAAERAEPDARLVIKTHPDVIAGKKHGYLTRTAAARGHTIIDEPINPWSVFDIVDTVYTVTSQLGFEALLAGKRVRCFGLPFYAGWGVTEDARRCVRRIRCRSIIEIFAAAYLVYARYVDPFTGQRCELEDTIELLADLKRHYLRTHGRTICLGFSPWKRRSVACFLATPGEGQVAFRRSPRRALREAKKTGARLVVWAADEPDGLAEAAKHHQVPILRMEDGFLRSVGLGSTFVRPSSLVLDDTGIHFDPSGPSTIETLLAHRQFSESILERARCLRDAIVRLRLSKYNTAGAPVPNIPSDSRLRVLVPGQVEDDASVRRGCPLVRSNRELLRAVREGLPDAYVIFKPHPDVEAGNRVGHLPEREARAWCDAVAHRVSVIDLINAVDEVHTMSSLTGFEALLRGKPVATYGAPFYAGWGLTTDRLVFPRRRRNVTLDELTAAALILYPIYLDPVTCRPCRVEMLLERFAERPVSSSGLAWLGRFRRLRSQLGARVPPVKVP